VKSGTFVTNEGTRTANQTPWKLDSNAFIFGATHGGYFKMVSVNSAGQQIECRYTDLAVVSSIGALTATIWAGAHRGGFYSAVDVVTGACTEGWDGYVEVAHYLATVMSIATGYSPPVLFDWEAEEQPGVLEGRNLFLIGSPLRNSVAARLNHSLPLTTTQGTDGASQIFGVGGCAFGGAGVRVLTLFPHSNTANSKAHVGLMLGGSDLRGLWSAVRLSIPAVVASTSMPGADIIPDFMVVGPQLAHQGAGGVLAMGFWGNFWQWSPAVSFAKC
jgi:hypothetical protein